MPARAAMPVPDIEIVQPTIDGGSSFAIIVDRTTYDRIGDAVNAYRASIEHDGLPAYVVVHAWESPDQVRSVLMHLRNNRPMLEGAVFVGDIPVPMIRDAQHMTTAFKLDQSRAWERSSVPSDRYYDDFDLEFSYLHRDSVNALFHYYSLKGSSPQRIDRDIYSGRIIAPVHDESKYEMLAAYLFRVAEQKQETNNLDYLLTYNGHGYHSESLNAWEGNLQFVWESFPQLTRPGGTIKNYYHTMGPNLKATLLTELQHPDVDLALFHAHGGNQAQYIHGGDRPRTLDQYVEYIRRFLRSRLRRAQNRDADVEAVYDDYRIRFDIPEAWFAGAFDDSVATADSLISALMDIYYQDIRGINPRPKVIIFDQCFNGNFSAENYVAGEYVFNTGGRTVAAVGNSVNVLQDIWMYELIGVLGHGVRIGLWHQKNNTLENHIIGDPTFRYGTGSPDDYNSRIVIDAGNTTYWSDRLTAESGTERALGLYMLFRHYGEEMTTELVDIYRRDSAATVRMQALKSLATLRNDAFESILTEAIRDPHELIRRKSASWMGEVGKEEYIPYLVEARISDNSERVSYNARYALDKINPDRTHEVARDYVAKLPPSADIESIMWRHVDVFENTTERLEEDGFARALDETAPDIQRIRAVRTFRLYNYQSAIPVLIEVATSEKSSEAVATAALEVLGWFTFSHNRQRIIEICEELLNREGVPDAVAGEALKTKNRLITGANHPLTP
jgi:hypothetical protein